MARFRIKAAHHAEAEAVLRAAATDFDKEPDGDGAVFYRFSKEQEAALVATGVLDRLPLHWWAGYAVASGPPTLN